jgi:uracil-DNA glycosylase
MKILFVGSNPSNSSLTDAAFHGSTQSSKILTDWCANIKNGFFVHVNVINKKTENNRPLSRKEIQDSLNSLKQNIAGIKPDRIIALGKTASTALTLLQVDFFEMPHPSGKNRMLNDKQYVTQKVNDLVKYCSIAR